MRRCLSARREEKYFRRLGGWDRPPARGRLQGFREICIGWEQGAFTTTLRGGNEAAQSG